MEQQLLLIDEDPADWRLDEQTCEIGRSGIQAARQALAEARQRALAPSEREAA